MRDLSLCLLPQNRRQLASYSHDPSRIFLIFGGIIPRDFYDISSDMAFCAREKLIFIDMLYLLNIMDKNSFCHPRILIFFYEGIYKAP